MPRPRRRFADRIPFVVPSDDFSSLYEALKKWDRSSDIDAKVRHVTRLLVLKLVKTLKGSGFSNGRYFTTIKIPVSRELADEFVVLDTVRKRTDLEASMLVRALLVSSREHKSIDQFIQSLETELKHEFDAEAQRWIREA